MGSLISGIYDLSQGDPTQKEQQKFGSLADYQTGVGQGLTTAGAGFDEAILSGDQSRIAQAEAPEIAAQQGQIQQNALTNAQFGNRSGGTNASTQGAQAAGRANLIELTGGLQRGAAESALSHGGNLLSQASGNLGNQAQLDSANRARMIGDVGGIAQGAAEIAGGVAGGAAEIAGGVAGGVAGGGGIDPGTFSNLMTSGTVQPQQLDESTYTSDLHP